MVTIYFEFKTRATFCLKKLFCFLYFVLNVIYHMTLYLEEILHRGSYMSAHVFLNLLNELGKSDKM